MPEIFMVIGVGVLVALQLMYIAFALGKSYGYQQARNEDASSLLGRAAVKDVESVNEMAGQIAKTLMSDEALDKKTIYIVRPSDAHAVHKLLKESKICESYAPNISDDIIKRLNDPQSPLSRYLEKWLTRRMCSPQALRRSRQNPPITR